MNNFTKEELGFLLWAVDELEQIETALVWLRADFKVDYVELHQKLQSLIDSYCEHKENVTTLYTISGDYPFGGFCRDCGSLVDEED